MNSDPATPIYFDIGEAIAAIGILLAFIALANPRRTFRWGLGWFRLRTAYFLFFLGITFVLIAAVLPILTPNLAGIGSKPIFWEVCAGLFFALGSLGLILSGSRPVRFTRWNAQHYFELCYSVIARGDDQELGALAEEISASAKSVVAACKGYDRFAAHAAKKSGGTYTVTPLTQWACSLMDLWSDRRFCNIVVTRCPGTAIVFLQEIKVQRLYHSGGYSFVKQLISEAFRDANSILHREERYSGLGHFLPFTETVFGEYHFVSSIFRPLQAAGYQHDTIRNLEKFTQCLLRATEAFLKARSPHDDTSAIWCGVDILAKSGWVFAGKLEEDKHSARIEDRPFWALHHVTEGFKELFKLIEEHEKNIPNCPFDGADVDGLGDKSIFGIFARGMYDYYDGLTRTHGQDEDVRHVALDLWMDIYPPSSRLESRSMVEVQKRFEARVWAQVKKNLEDRHFCYPMITRLLVSMVGLDEHPQASNGEKRVSEKLRTILKAKFQTAAKLDEKRARELLPENYSYDKEKNIIVMHNRWDDPPRLFSCD